MYSNYNSENNTLSVTPSTQGGDFQGVVVPK